MKKNHDQSSSPVPYQRPLSTLFPRRSELVAPLLLIIIFIMAVIFRPHGTDLIDYSIDLGKTVLKNGIGRALLALGAGLVLASAGVDLSMAGVLAIAGVIFAWASQGMTNNWYILTPLVCLCAIIGALFGVFNGWSISKWKAPPLILTWAVGAMAMIFAALLAALLPRNIGTASQYANSSGIPIAQAISSLSSDTQFLLTALAFLLVALPTAIGAFNLGRNARAIGANRISATYAGIRVKRALMATYATSGAFAALAGVWFSLLERKALTTVHGGVELSAIAIAVLGGTSMSGGYFSVIPIVCAAFLWSLLLGVLQRPDLLPEFFNAQLQSRAAEATFAVLLIIVGIWAGRGLSGDTVSINVISRLEEK